MQVVVNKYAPIQTDPTAAPVKRVMPSTVTEELAACPVEGRTQLAEEVSTPRLAKVSSARLSLRVAHPPIQCQQRHDNLTDCEPDSLLYPRKKPMYHRLPRVP